MANPFETFDYSSRETQKTLFQDEPFNPEHYIEKLARPNADHVILGQDGSKFDPKPLREVLKLKLSELETQFENKTKQVKRVEELNLKKQAEFKRKTKEHDQFLAMVDSQYQELDKVINFVSTKVVHLGDQLKQMDGKRKRAYEAKELLDYINEAQTTGKISSSIFSDHSKIHEAARVIHKITLAAQDLPDKGVNDFTRLHQVLTSITDDIEKRLVRDFKLSLQYYDEQKHRDNMKRCSTTLNLPCFQAYKDIVEHFIEVRLKAPFYGDDIFSGIKDCIDETSDIISYVFSDHDNIMPKFIKLIFKEKIKKKVMLTLKPEKIKTADERTANDLEQLLDSLADLYSHTLKLSQDLSKYDNDFSFVTEVKKTIFPSYLSEYTKWEIEYLLKVSTEILEQFYDSIKHDKKVNLDTFQTHMKDFRAKFKHLSDNIGGSNPSLNLNEPTDMPSDQLLSVNVTTSLLKVHDKAVMRSVLLCDPQHISRVIMDIAKSLLSSYVTNHLEYAIDHFTESRSMLEFRTEPVMRPFLTTVGNSNITFHNLDRFFNNKIIPNIADPKILNEVRQLKQNEMGRIEEKISNEINVVITSVILWIKNILKSRQEKEDFNSACSAQNATRACNEVCSFLNHHVIQTFKGPIDGDNLKHVMLELGVRFHGALLDHLLQYQYSYPGGLQLIQDLHTYKQAIKHFKEPTVDQLFEAMNELCQLLIVEPNKLRLIWDEGNLSKIEHGFLVQFVKLRTDYRKNNVQNFLPAYSPQVRQC